MSGNRKKTRPPFSRRHEKRSAVGSPASEGLRRGPCLPSGQQGNRHILERFLQQLGAPSAKVSRNAPRRLPACPRARAPPPVWLGRFGGATQPSRIPSGDAPPSRRQAPPGAGRDLVPLHREGQASCPSCRGRRATPPETGRWGFVGSMRVSASSRIAGTYVGANRCTYVHMCM